MRRTMRRGMRKNQDTPFKRYDAQPTELNNNLPLFPGLSDTKKMAPEELNKILLYAITNGWANQSYL